jgi:hypothetical protein
MGSLAPHDFKVFREEFYMVTQFQKIKFIPFKGYFCVPYSFSKTVAVHPTINFFQMIKTIFSLFKSEWQN